jgi:hypothetical protein|tara:strand:- start:823 stop:2025 length:1203 start_codon:yes stop_codon:yes gene_type:complete
MNWLQDVTDSASELEPPQAFFYWSAMCALASTVNGNVYLDRHSYRLYPNIYVMLIADSGLRKGVPINLAKRLARAAKANRVISGRNSIQAVIQVLGKSTSLEGGGMIKTAKGFLISGEFSNFIVKDEEALTILTDLYDSGYNDEWENTLKHSGVDKLKSVNLTMLGASNPTHFEAVVSKRDVEGGFIARTFLIYEEKKHTLNSLAFTPDKIPNEEKLGEWLKKIRDVKGAFTWGDGAQRHYDEWYIKYNRDTAKRKLKDKTGTASRFEDHVLKVAMLISLSKSVDLVIGIEDIQEAIDTCFRFLLTVDKMMMSSGTGKSASGEQTKVVVGELISCYPKEISRKKLLQKNWGDIAAFELDGIIETLVQGGICSMEPRGPEIFYRMTDNVYELYNRAIEEGK